MIEAHGKLNLSLDILGKREDGYHDVAMIMQSVVLCDFVSVERNMRKEISVYTNHPEIPNDDRNLAYRACQEMYKLVMLILSNEGLTPGCELMNDFAENLINGVIEHDEELVNIANKYLNNWNISRLGLTDAAILRIAIYELLYTDTPKIIAINEAIELAKLYSDEDVRKMINATMDKIYHECVNNE